MKKTPTVVCFGEVLWDVFPEAEKIGGAPLNFALCLNRLGIETFIASQIGNDSIGKRLIVFLEESNLDTKFIQNSSSFSTGVAIISKDTEGSARYEIPHPVAWDKIETTPELIDVVSNSSVFLYGSLVARDKASKNTLIKLLSCANFKVFDVNLRPPHYDYLLLDKLLCRADFIKFNDEELNEISKYYGCQSSQLKDQLAFMALHTKATYICVTKGSDGAILYHEGNYYNQNGFTVKVVDTVGAGDSFLATLLEGILTNRSLNDALRRACAMGALVAGSAGANVKISETNLRDYIAQFT
ncbi:MAG: carbohydrate kinase [Flavobacteriaceae bacterium]